MARIGFIGLGNMGGPMAANLAKAGHQVTGFDLQAEALTKAEAAGIARAATPGDCAREAEVLVTMLPAGQQVRALYLGEEGLLALAPKGCLFIDSSTIDVGSARAVQEAAGAAGQDFVDAPVSGGVAGAEAGTLTFMCGGLDAAFARAEPLLAQMGRSIIHAGGPGNGQAAKVCNNMLLGISMLGVCETFALAEKLGLDSQALFDISSKSSGSCWAMLNHLPVPGIVESSAANRDYKPGFAAAMMLKDLRLSQEAANQAGAATPLGAEAAALFGMFVAAGNGGLDYSAIIKMVKGS
ncbi:MAG: 3-hydroxyisobutyrate dehydrogenase [Rhodospirillales bacterium]